MTDRPANPPIYEIQLSDAVDPHESRRARLVAFDDSVLIEIIRPVHEDNPSGETKVEACVMVDLAVLCNSVDILRRARVAQAAREPDPTSLAYSRPVDHFGRL
jgi:hypothetical protein